MKNKTFFLLFALMLGFAKVNAQSNNENYVYGVVQYSNAGDSRNKIYVTLNDKFELIPVSKDEFKNSFDYTPLLKKIKSLSDEGWEVINVSYENSGIVVFYFLRKKIN
jgi:hypothetical protein